MARTARVEYKSSRCFEDDIYFRRLQLTFLQRNYIRRRGFNLGFHANLSLNVSPFYIGMSKIERIELNTNYVAESTTQVT